MGYWDSRSRILLFCCQPSSLLSTLCSHSHSSMLHVWHITCTCGTSHARTAHHMHVWHSVQRTEDSAHTHRHTHDVMRCTHNHGLMIDRAWYTGCCRPGIHMVRLMTTGRGLHHHHSSSLVITHHHSSLVITHPHRCPPPPPPHPPCRQTPAQACHVAGGRQPGAPFAAASGAPAAAAAAGRRSGGAKVRGARGGVGA